MSRPVLGVVGGGLAGISAALTAADAGAEVVLFERRGVLGGLTSSVERGGRTYDNGQHVFLRCCTEYLALLERLGARGDVHLQDRCEVVVLAPGGRRASIARSGLPAPLHLARSLATYRHLSVADRLGLGRAALALRRLDPDDPVLDDETFAAWLRRHGQSAQAISRLWELIALPTINLRAEEASLALAVRVFREGLLDHRDAADVGWSLVPLRTLHGTRAHRALLDAGVDVRLSSPVRSLGRRGAHHVVVVEGSTVPVDALVVATPPAAACSLGVLDGAVASRLGTSPIVNVHLVFDRRVTDLAFFAAVGSPVQFAFDRSATVGLGAGQCLAISLSAADAELAEGSAELVARLTAALGELLPDARGARVVDAVVTRERAATFRGLPGTASLRPDPGLPTGGVHLAGAWCATGWPATMEGAVRSGRVAARAALSSVAPARDLVGTAR